MFLDYLKNLFAKKIVKKQLGDTYADLPSQPVRTVGILLDERFASAREDLINTFEQHGISSDQIDVLVYKKRVRKDEVFDYPVFRPRDLSWRATFEKSEVREFIARPFDLLLNYYQGNLPGLMVVSNLSKAKFKVGFGGSDKKLNHLIIEADPEQSDVFTEELFRYLKILKKI